MVYVVSDIHGNMQRWQSIKRQIKLKPNDRLYILGDVVDRYPDGLKILREIMKAPNMTMLKGNHEYMMQQYFETGCDGHCERLWYNNGGFCTHSAFKHCRKEYRKEILNYIASLPINIDIEVNGRSILLVHGAPIEAQHLSTRAYESDEAFSVWQRLRPYDMLYMDKLVIYGHTPVFCYESDLPAKIMIRSDKIDIDCGCGYEFGRLACLRLDDMAEFYSD